MHKAKLLKYSTTSIALGGFGGDQFNSSPAKAVYVPKETVFVRPDNSSNIIMGPPHKMYQALVGPQAEEAYKGLIATLSKNKPYEPEQIEVSDEFVAWAKAMHAVRNPSADIADLLKVF